MNIIWSEKINLIQILLGLKNHLNTNTNIKKITRIRIRILFGLKILTEYEYEYFGIRIPNYSLTSAGVVNVWVVNVLQSFQMTVKNSQNKSKIH